MEEITQVKKNKSTKIVLLVILIIVLMGGSFIGGSYLASATKDKVETNQQEVEKTEMFETNYLINKDNEFIDSLISRYESTFQFSKTVLTNLYGMDQLCSSAGGEGNECSYPYTDGVWTPEEAEEDYIRMTAIQNAKRGLVSPYITKESYEHSMEMLYGPEISIAPKSIMTGDFEAISYQEYTESYKINYGDMGGLDGEWLEKKIVEVDSSNEDTLKVTVAAGLKSLQTEGDDTVEVISKIIGQDRAPLVNIEDYNIDEDYKLFDYYIFNFKYDNNKNLYLENIELQIN